MATYPLQGPDGAPLLMLGNSLGSTSAMWDAQMPALAQRWRVLRFDHPGHGSPDAPDGPYTLDQLGRHAVEILDGLGAQRVHYCGLSLGGMVGMWLAINAPQRIDRLVLCCTSANMPPPEAWQTRIDTVLAAASTEPIADMILGRWLTAGYRTAHPDQAARLRAMLVATPAAGYAGCCAAIRDMDLRGQLASISAPTLVIAGADDEATPPAHGQVIADSIPGARIEVVGPAAHFANVEQPGTVTELIVNHLETA